MKYFLMIHWSDTHLSPVMDDDDQNVLLFDSYEEAKAAIDRIPVSQSREITIHDDCGE